MVERDRKYPKSLKTPQAPNIKYIAYIVLLSGSVNSPYVVNYSSKSRFLKTTVSSGYLVTNERASLAF